MSAGEASARRALVLHDQRPVVHLIQSALKLGPFEVRAASSLAEAEAILDEWPPAMAVVDMDHDDSKALLQRLGILYALTRNLTPVLGLTHRSDLRTKLRAFELGVDDVLTTPFSPDELLARSIVLVRRVSGAHRSMVPIISFGQIEVDILDRQVHLGGELIHLSWIEQHLLYLLASRAGQVVTQEEIIDAIWGPDHVREPAVVDRYIRSLRVKLENDHDGPHGMVTASERGYRFIQTETELGPDGDLKAVISN